MGLEFGCVECINGQARGLGNSGDDRIERGRLRRPADRPQLSGNLTECPGCVGVDRKRSP